MTGRIPELAATDLDTARAWFAQVVEAMGGKGWHADDGVDDLGIFTPDEAKAVSAAMSRIRQAAKHWPDFDILYDLAAYGTIPAERVYPGLVIDVSLPAGRLGYPSIPGRDVPNVLMEDYSQYVILEFPEADKPVSQQSTFVMKTVFFPGADMDLATAVVDEEDFVVFHDIREAENRLLEIAGYDPGPRP